MSKLAAAKIATRAGCSVGLARRVEPHPLARLEAGGACTRFPARANPRRARKEWLAATLEVMGVIRIDAGAARALKRGSSLLPAGPRDPLAWLPMLVIGTSAGALLALDNALNFDLLSTLYPVWQAGVAICLAMALRRTHHA